MTESQAVEDVSVYGAAVYGASAGSGTPVNSVRANGFALVGASTTSPGWGLSTAAGSSCTVTFDTSTTVTGVYIVGSIEAGHARNRGAVGCTWTLLNAGDLTTAWAAT